MVYDCWKMCCIMGDISLAVSISIFAEISSGSGAFLVPFSPISRV